MTVSGGSYMTVLSGSYMTPNGRSEGTITVAPKDALQRLRRGDNEGFGGVIKRGAKG